MSRKRIFRVFDSEFLGDMYKSFEVIDAEDAALAYALYYNTTTDYDLMNEEINIRVVDDQDEETYYKIAAEPDVYYTADEISKTEYDEE